MEFTVTKEQILEFANWGNPDNKKKLKEWFPKAFELQLEVGKWYKSKYGEIEWLMNYQGSGCVSYGFTPKEWINGYVLHNHDNWTPATTEEVESALIAEAKKRGFKKGVNCLFGSEKNKRTISTNEIIWDAEWSGKGGLCMGMNVIFTDGKWAEILPEEKTIITKGKALRIIAKKLKVSPESIEIQ